MAKHRKHHRRHHRRHHSHGFRLNPGGALSAVISGPKEMISAEFIKEAASVAAGFILPGLVLPRLPTMLRDQTWKAYGSKVLVVAALSAGAGVAVSKRAAKLVLLGGGVSILLDLYADYVAPMISGIVNPAPAAPPAAPSGSSWFFGNPGDPGMRGLGDPGDYADAYDYDMTPQLGAYYGNKGDPGVSGLALAFS